MMIHLVLRERDIIGQRTTLVPAEFGGAPFAWNDMDMLQAGNYKQAAHANGREGNMTAVEYSTEVSMWAIFASSFVVTTPILNCSTGSCEASITSLQQELLLNTDVLAINQDSSPGARLLWPPSFDATGIKVYGRFLSDGDVAVALCNLEDTTQDVTFSFSLLGWGSGTSASVRDLWAHTDRGISKDRYPQAGSVSVEAHATVLLRLRRVAVAADEGTLVI